MLTAHSCAIFKNWKQPKCPSNKLWYIYIMNYYSEIKRNKLLIYATILINLKGIKLNAKKAHLKRVHII